jgi:hypothetical protein
MSPKKPVSKTAFWNWGDAKASTMGDVGLAFPIQSPLLIACSREINTRASDVEALA